MASRRRGAVFDGLGKRVCKGEEKGMESHRPGLAFSQRTPMQVPGGGARPAG